MSKAWSFCSPRPASRKERGRKSKAEQAAEKGPGPAAGQVHAAAGLVHHSETGQLVDSQSVLHCAARSLRGAFPGAGRKKKEGRDQIVYNNNILDKDPSGLLERKVNKKIEKAEKERSKSSRILRLPLPWTGTNLLLSRQINQSVRTGKRCCMHGHWSRKFERLYRSAINAQSPIF
ncbi:hypothetical protein SORBI_3004G290850 [Sorghum bicolor]|uniref:Uncharacterized protein n=1 Tax=Sorghum bicolor TaxID=4558 RepID=A0A1Z5RQ43_SORBI|nr:hypothetical protein SORBI_3004G290850 [Sorghum bicolor]